MDLSDQSAYPYPSPTYIVASSPPQNVTAYPILRSVPPLYADSPPLYPDTPPIYSETDCGSPSGYQQYLRVEDVEERVMEMTDWRRAYRKLRRASAIIGASTVAIDNKIEQAMDLVKSHLMFAVREEVLVLKEQIKELLEKNSQLEYENSILRAAATQETLTKLSQTNPGPTQSSTS